MQVSHSQVMLKIPSRYVQLLEGVTGTASTTADSSGHGEVTTVTAALTRTGCHFVSSEVRASFSKKRKQLTATIGCSVV